MTLDAVNSNSNSENNNNSNNSHTSPARKRYTNKHLLYINSGYANKAQLTNTIKMALYQFNKKYNMEINTNFRINLVTRDDGRMMQFAYLWISNPEVYNLFLGLLPNGDPNVQTVPDPEWKGGDEEEIRQIEQELAETNDWGRIDLLESMLEDLRTPKQITIPAEDLIHFPRINYSEEQIRQIQATTATATTPATYVDITIEQGYVNEPLETFIPDTLYCKYVPEWISEKQLKSIFRPYLENPDLEVFRKIDGKKVKTTYPIISITKGRKGFVSFDPLTHDASFALAMCMRLPITEKKSEPSPPDKRWRAPPSQKMSKKAHNTTVLKFFYKEKRESFEKRRKR